MSAKFNKMNYKKKKSQRKLIYLRQNDGTALGLEQVSFLHHCDDFCGELLHCLLQIKKLKHKQNNYNIISFLPNSSILGSSC